MAVRNSQKEIIQTGVRDLDQGDPDREPNDTQSIRKENAKQECNESRDGHYDNIAVESGCACAAKEIASWQ